MAMMTRPFWVESEKQSYTLRRHIRFVPQDKSIPYVSVTNSGKKRGIALQIEDNQKTKTKTKTKDKCIPWRKKRELPQNICCSNRGQKRSNYCAKFLERTVIFSNYWLTQLTESRILESWSSFLKKKLKFKEKRIKIPRRNLRKLEYREQCKTLLWSKFFGCLVLTWQ